MAQIASPSTARIDFVEERATAGRAPTGGLGRGPIILAMYLEVCCEMLRRTMGSLRLGFWTDGMRWVGARRSRRHVSSGQGKMRPPTDDRRYQQKIETSVWVWEQGKTHWPSFPREMLEVDTERILWEPVVAFVDVTLDLSGSRLGTS